MKRITLCAINARYTHSSLALLCLKGAAKQNANIQIIEASINDSVSDIVNAVVEGRPGVVGFSCYIWNIELALKAASSVKKILPDCLLLLGGPEVSCDPAALMKRHIFIDMIIRGPGELPFAHFAERFEKGLSIESTPSASIRCGDDILTNDMAPPLDMDALPFLYDDLGAYTNRILYYETSRGCPYKCAYCMSANDNLSFLPVERVKREWEYFMKAGVRQVKLVDRTFNYPPDRARELFAALIELSKKHPQAPTNFHFEVSAFLLDESMLALLQTAPRNLIQLEIGIQSTHPETLAAINRRHDTKRLLENTGAICAMGNIHVHVDLIAGLPHEGYDDFAKSFNDAYALGAHQLQLGFLKVLKGSPMQALAKQYNIRHTDYPPYEVLSTHVLSYEELSMLHRIERLVEAMYNTGHFKMALRHILPVFESPFAFYEQFARYLEGCGYFERPQKKQRLFELLYGFIKELSGIGERIIWEALVYDWLCLEKPRTWPGGLEVRLTQAQKRLVRQYYEDSGWIAAHLPAYLSLSSGETARRCFMIFFERLFGGETAVVFDYEDSKNRNIIKIDSYRRN